MPKLIAVLAAVLVGAVVALGLCQVLNGRDICLGRNEREGKVVWGESNKRDYEKQQSRALDVRAYALSDRRLKTDLVLEATSPTGVPIYTWRYKPGMPHGMDTDRRYRGTVAQELPEHYAHARAMGGHGYWRVNYSRLDVDMEEVDEERNQEQEAT